jgi:fibronectin-binding autotransporter adhesin
VVVDYAPGTSVASSYTILTAAGGLGGTEFESLDDDPTLPGLVTSLDYDANNVYLTTTSDRSDPDFGALAGNQQAVADAILGFFDRTGTLPVEFADLDASGLTQVSGEPAAGAIIAGIDSADQFIAVLNDRGEAGQGSGGAGGAAAYAGETGNAGSDRFASLGMSASHNADPADFTPAGHWRVWGAAYGGTEMIGGDPAAGSHDTRADTFGLVGGVVREWSDTSLGIALGGGSSSFSLSDGLGDGNADSFNAGVFARHGFGDAYVSGVLAYGFHDTETNRTLPGDSVSASFNAHTFSGRVEGGWHFDTPVAVLTPYAAFQAVAYRLPAYSETSAGSGTFALDYDADTTTATRGELGLGLDHTIFLDDSGKLTLAGRAAWAINGGAERRVTPTFQSLPGATFTIDGAEPDVSSLLVDAGARYVAPSGFFASLAFQGEFSGNVESYAGWAKIGFTW